MGVAELSSIDARICQGFAQLPLAKRSRHDLVARHEGRGTPNAEFLRKRAVGTEPLGCGFRLETTAIGGSVGHTRAYAFSNPVAVPLPFTVPKQLPRLGANLP